MKSLVALILSVAMLGQMANLKAQQTNQKQQAGSEQTMSEATQILAQAKKAAAEIEHPASKLSVFIDVATEHTRLANRELAISTLKECIALLKEIKDSDRRYHGAIFTLELCGRNGVIDEALEIVSSTSYEIRKDALIGRLITGAADAGLEQNALMLTSKIKSQRERDSAFQDIAVGQAERGMTNQALKTVMSIQSQQLRRTAMLLIVVTLLENADLENAISVTQKMDNSTLKVRALVEIAETQFKVKDITSAKATFQQAEDLATTLKEPTAYMISRAQAKLGNFESAIAAAKSVSEQDDKDTLFKEITMAQAEAGFPDEALKAFGSIINEFDQDIALKSIAIEQSKTGDSEAALKTIKRIKNPYFRSEAFRKMARVQFEMENHKQAKAYCERALQEANLLELGGGSKVIAICKVAVAQAETGDKAAAEKTFQHALQIAKSILDEPGMPYSLPTVAEEQAKVFGANKPLKWILKLPSARHRADALTAVAQGISE